MGVAASVEADAEELGEEAIISTSHVARASSAGVLPVVS